jgi:hypothetical protein
LYKREWIRYTRAIDGFEHTHAYTHRDPPGASLHSSTSTSGCSSNNAVSSTSFPAVARSLTRVRIAPALPSSSSAAMVRRCASLPVSHTHSSLLAQILTYNTTGFPSTTQVATPISMPMNAHNSWLKSLRHPPHSPAQQQCSLHACKSSSRPRWSCARDEFRNFILITMAHCDW